MFEFATGRQYLQRRIGEDGDRITSLSFDGDRVAYIKADADSEAITVLQVVPGAQERTIELPDDADELFSISFTRLPLAKAERPDQAVADFEE